MTTTTTSTRTQYREALAGLVAKTQAKFPALNGRLTSATKLALLDDVELHDDGSATVHSASDPSKTYAVAGGACDCQDFPRAPEHLCQHRLAAGLVRKAHELLPKAPEPELLQTAAHAQPQHHEAPASVNLKVLHMGHEVMITLRDSDETALLARLGVLLARKDVRPLPKPTPRPGQYRK